MGKTVEQNIIREMQTTRHLNPRKLRSWILQQYPSKSPDLEMGDRLAGAWHGWRPTSRFPSPWIRRVPMAGHPSLPCPRTQAARWQTRRRFVPRTAPCYVTPMRAKTVYGGHLTIRAVIVEPGGKARGCFTECLSRADHLHPPAIDCIALPRAHPSESTTANK